MTFVNLLLWMGLIWVLLAVAAWRFPALRPLYRGLSRISWQMLVATAHWLWRPDMERRGGGTVEPPQMRFDDSFDEEIP